VGREPSAVAVGLSVSIDAGVRGVPDVRVTPVVSRVPDLELIWRGVAMTVLRAVAVCLVVGLVSVGCGGTAETTSAGAACKCETGCKCDHCGKVGGVCGCGS